MKIDKQIIDGGLRCRWRHFTLIIIIKSVFFVPTFVIFWSRIITGFINHWFVWVIAVLLAVFTIGFLWTVVRNLFGKEFLQLDKTGYCLNQRCCFIISR